MRWKINDLLRSFTQWLFKSSGQQAAFNTEKNVQQLVSVLDGCHYLYRYFLTVATLCTRVMDDVGWSRQRDPRTWTAERASSLKLGPWAGHYFSGLVAVSLNKMSPLPILLLFWRN